MAESNATQVILTDDGIKIINAQNTANNAASGVANLNDPNLMSVIEKQTQTAQYAGLTSQYNVVLARAKEASISTTALTTAYTNLNTFMSAILTDTTKASDVNRDTYKSLTDAYNTALGNVQTALSNSFNTDIDNMQSSVAVASQAASSAAIVASQATTTGNNASQVASQAASAANQASADYTALSAGVEDGSVIHITTKTAIDNAIIGTAEIADAAITDAKMGNISANHLTAGSIDFNTITGKNINASNITTGTLSTDRLNVAKLSALSANLGDVTTGSLKGVDIVANSFSTPNGSFTTDSNGNVVASNLTIRGVTNLVYNAALLGGVGGSSPNVPGWNLFTKGYYSNFTLHDGVSSIGFNSSTGGAVWTTFAQSKLYPLNGLTGQPYSASVWFMEYGSDTALMYQFTLAFFDSNGNRINGGYAGQTWSGINSSQPWRYITINNVVSPSNAVYVGIQYWAYNGTGHAMFSSPMLTQTAQSTGYQPDTGNIVSAGEIDGSVINGSTINGTTINGGTTSTNTYNVNKLAPLTIASDGTLTSTNYLNSIGAQAQIIDGELSTKYREFTPLAGTNYTAREVALGDGLLTLTDGYTTTSDTGFNLTPIISGQTILSAQYGLQLYGPTQQIYFSGTDENGVTGISMNSYGNIIGNSSATWWRIVSNAGSNVANFGIDTAGSNVIQFNRELDIGNFQINTGHTFTSADNQAIHFAMGKGGAADIYAGAVNYTSLVKSSLLSVKKDVKKADTAYWAQLVNSIDLATYQYKSDDNTSHLRLSSIVDDVNDTKQWQLPDVFINRDEDGKLSGVDDSVLLNATLATVQEQQKEIDQLNGHNMELEARLNKLEAKLNG
ncbi:phage tail protein [Lactiplantibacillus plantarum subsp. plantarum]|uniref:phage tail protein n=1 Tax=Lactiplantibacillus plantarum TaxID=1590 RepID=UPI0010FBF39A|nr:phage tail protein [Lactiplantibacillus plantarum]QCS76890.1 phage tail protein [Lactiplantibacillus plantarum subsp. plantarum]